MNKRPELYKVALSIALLFHASAIIGILFTPYKDWFIKSTWINLLLMASLLIATHPQKKKKFFLFILIICIAGFGIEVLGINTAFVFGRYMYGSTLGLQLFNVPVITCNNWFIIIYCAGMFTQSYENYLLRRLTEKGLAVSTQLRLTSFIIDGVFLTVLFDWIMEPVAVKLGYWHWQDDIIPLYNYVSWMFVSAAMLAIFRKLNGGSHNIFAVHLFIIQLLFFAVLRTFL